MSDKTADDALAELQAALAKSDDEAVNEAGAAFDEAVKADKAFADAVAKAGMPANFKKKPKADADGDDDGDEDVDHAEPDGDECDDAAKVAKAAHEVVGAYVDTAAAAVVDGKVPGPWAEFSKKAQDYYASINKSLQQTADEWRKKAAEHKDTVAKAANDDAKAENERAAETLAKLADVVTAQADLAKGLAERVTLPRVEPTLAEPLKLDSPIDLGKGEDWMPIQSKADVMAAVEKYKQVSLKDQPMVTTHIFNAAKALKASLPEGWHAPTTLDPERAKSTGSDATVRTYDITEGQKSAAMAKGLTIIGPAATLLSTIRAVNATPMLERYLSTEPKQKARHDELQAWMKKGDELLKDLIGGEADAIWMLDLPTFPAEQFMVKADYWAETASKVVLDTTDDAMSVEQRTIRKDFASRLVDAVDDFQKAAGINDSDKDAEIERLTKELEGSTAKTVELESKLTKFTDQLPPLIRQAQKRGEDLKKAHATIAERDATIEKLKREPVPSKGRAGNGDGMLKVDDPNGDGSGAAETGKDLLAKAAAVLPGATRESKLLEAAYRFRAEDE